MIAPPLVGVGLLAVVNVGNWNKLFTHKSFIPLSLVPKLYSLSANIVLLATSKDNPFIFLEVTVSACNISP